MPDRDTRYCSLTYPTRGVAAAVVSLGMGSFFVAFVVLFVSDLARGDPERLPTGVWGWIGAAAVYGPLTLGTGWAAIGIWFTGVYADDQTLTVRQISRVRRFSRREVTDVVAERASGRGLPRARLRVTTGDGTSTACELYGSNQTPMEAEFIATALRRWRDDLGRDTA